MIFLFLIEEFWNEIQDGSNDYEDTGLYENIYHGIVFKHTIFNINMVYITNCTCKPEIWSFDLEIKINKNVNFTAQCCQFSIFGSIRKTGHLKIYAKYFSQLNVINYLNVIYQTIKWSCRNSSGISANVYSTTMENQILKVN